MGWGREVRVRDGGCHWCGGVMRGGGQRRGEEEGEEIGREKILKERSERWD